MEALTEEGTDLYIIPNTNRCAERFAQGTGCGTCHDCTVLVSTFGNFFTAGVNVKLNRRINIQGNITGELHYREYGVGAPWREGHFFAIYDNRHMATSMFNLEPGTRYEVRVIIREGGSIKNIEYGEVTTRPEFTVPTGSNIRVINNNAEFAAARSAGLNPGDELRLAPGDYTSFTLNNVHGTAENPIIITSLTGDMPSIRGQMRVENSSHIVFHNIRFTNMGIPTSANLFEITGTSNHITLSSNHLHDGDGGRLLGLAGNPHMPFANHLIINNVFADEEHDPDHAWNVPADNRTYYGIFFYESGNTGRELGGITIRNNTFHGMYDAIHSGGREKQPPTHFCPIHRVYDVDDFLNTWGIQELDIFQNVFFNLGDDAIEADGHQVNARYFWNKIGWVHTAFSTAAAFPGPMFFVENTSHSLQEGGLKFNTGIVGGNLEMTHNVFIYNNTFVHYETDEIVTSGARSSVIPWFNGMVGTVIVENNIFVSRSRIMEGTVDAAWAFFEDYRQDFNLFWTWVDQQGRRGPDAPVVARSMQAIDGAGALHTNFLSWDAYVTGNFRGNDQNSIFANPMIDTSLDLRYHHDALMMMLTLDPASPAINAGRFIPGISRSMTPNIGADHNHNTGASPAAPPDPVLGLYSVTFDGNRYDGGVVPTAIQTQQSMLVTIPAQEPTRLHYTFVGWSTDPMQLAHAGAEGTIWTAGQTFMMPQGGRTLYAVWQISAFGLLSLDFRVRDVPAEFVGTPGWSVPPSVSMAIDRAIPGRIVLYQSQATNVGLANITRLITGGPQPNRVTYLAYDDFYWANPLQGVNNRNNWNAGQLHTLATGDRIVLRIDDTYPVNTRFYFVIDVVVIPDVIGGPSLTYNANHGTGNVPSAFNSYEGANITVAFYPQPTREHFTFRGWSTNPNQIYHPNAAGYNAIFRDGVNYTFTMGTDPVVLYAVWDIEVFTVNSLTIRGVAPLYMGTPGTGVAPAVPATFGRIRLTEAQATAIERGDIVFSVGPYNINKVTAHAHDGRLPFFGPTQPPTMLGVNNANAWNPGHADEPITFQNGDMFGFRVDLPAQAQRFYFILVVEIWDGTAPPPDEFAVSFDANQGTGAVPATAEFAEGATVTVAFDTVPTRAHFNFVGWSKNPNQAPQPGAPGYADIIRAGNPTFTMPDEAVTLYAVWEFAEPIFASIAIHGVQPGYLGAPIFQNDTVATRIIPGSITLTESQAASIYWPVPWGATRNTGDIIILNAVGGGFDANRGGRFATLPVGSNFTPGHAELWTQSGMPAYTVSIEDGMYFGFQLSTAPAGLGRTTFAIRVTVVPDAE